MDLEKQVVSLELAKRLKELGVGQESYWYWVGKKEFTKGQGWAYNWFLLQGTSSSVQYTKNQPNRNVFSAFTVAELGNLFPTGQFWKDESNPRVIRTFKAMGEGGIWFCELAEGTEVYPAPMAKPVYREVDKNEANARAKILIYLLENKLI